MKSDKLFKVLILAFLFGNPLFAQVGYVDYNNPVYSFLERMNSLHILKDYNNFELPKTRRQIGVYLNSILKNKNKLTSTDQRILADFLIEFEYETKGMVNKFSSLLPALKLNSLLSENEKYLYSYHDSTKTSLFVNFVGDAQYLFLSEPVKNYLQNTTVFNFGGLIRGSLFNHFGFSIKATNGTFTGNRQLTLTTGPRRYNYKLQNDVTSSNLGHNFFDQTEGFLLADYNFLQFKIGRDRQSIGYGPVKYILSDNPPKMDYLSLSLNYKSINFSFFHGKLLGLQTSAGNNLEGQINSVEDKYIAYHRLGLNFSRHFQLGAGEIVIYGNRSIDFSYLNPFNFYKSTEHANQDRDNSMLFFDFVNNSIKGLKFYSTILIDDMDFGKIGTGWYGNQILYDFGIYSSQLYNIFPVEFDFQYLHIEPYVYTHRIKNNNFTTLGFNLADQLQPNSETFLLKATYTINYRLKISALFIYSIHGANKTTDGKIVNFGGDINLGHRVSDPEYVKFLDGFREYSRILQFDINYEPVNNYLLNFKLIYTNGNLIKSKVKKIFSNLSFSIKI